MAIVIGNNFEGGTAGTAISIGNSGGVSGTPLSLVTKASVATANFSATGKAHGQLGVRCTCAAGTDAYRLRWDYAANTGGVTSLSVYFTLNGNPGQTQDLMNIASASGQALKVGVTVTTNVMRVTNLTGAAILTTGLPTLVVGTNYRLEAQVKKGTTTTDGQAAVQLYAGDSLTSLYAQSATNVNMGTTDFNRVDLGENTAGRTIDITWDDLRVDNATQTPLGPLESVRAPRIQAAAVMRASNF